MAILRHAQAKGIIRYIVSDLVNDLASQVREDHLLKMVGDLDAMDDLPEFLEKHGTKIEDLDI